MVIVKGRAGARLVQSVSNFAVDAKLNGNFDHHERHGVITLTRIERDGSEGITVIITNDEIHARAWAANMSLAVKASVVASEVEVMAITNGHDITDPAHAVGELYEYLFTTTEIKGNCDIIHNMPLLDFID